MPTRQDPSSQPLLKIMGIRVYTNEKSLTQHVCVFDVDETLVHTYLGDDNEEHPIQLAEKLGIYNNSKYMDIRNRAIRIGFDDPRVPRGSGSTYDCWGIMRPHLKKHLKFAFRYFRKVIIWSAGLKEYVNKITSFINNDNRKFDLVYHRWYCDVVDGVHVKPLAKMINKHPEIGPIEHMFIIDDREDIAVYNMDNLILIPTYSPKISVKNREAIEKSIRELRKDDDAFEKLETWLMQPHVMKAKDVRTLDKSGIF